MPCVSRREEDVDRPIFFRVIGLDALHPGEPGLDLGTRARLELEVIGGEEQRIAVGVLQLRRDLRLAIERLHRLLPALDQIAAEGLVSKPLHGDGSFAPQPSPCAANHVGRFGGRQRAWMRATH